MSPGDKIRAVLHELGVHQYDLLWQTSAKGKAHSFTVRAGDVTLHGCTTRSIIRAIRRHWATEVVATAWMLAAPPTNRSQP